MIPGSNPVLSFRPPQADSGGQTRTPQVFMIELADKIKIIDAPITADEEAALLDQGSEQKNLWGINIYVGQPQDSRLEFDSMISLSRLLNMEPNYSGATTLAVKGATPCGSHFTNENAPEGAIAGATPCGSLHSVNQPGEWLCFGLAAWQ